MSKGGGGGGSTTTVQKADPWAGLQQPLQALYGSALDWYNSGTPQYYPGNTVAPINPMTQQAMGMGANRAMQGTANQPLLDTAASTLQRNASGVPLTNNPAYGTMAAFSGGNVVGSNPAQNFFQSAAAGGYNADPSQGFFGSVQNGAWNNINAAQPYFQNATNGAYLNANPYVNQMVQNAQRPVVQNFQNAIAPALASQFSAAGRTGSGAHQAAFGQATDALGRTLGDISSGLYGQNYANERGLQQQAAGALMGQQNQDRAYQMQAAQDLANRVDATRNFQMQGAQQLGAMNANERAQQLQAAQSIGNLYGQQQELGQAAALAAPGFATANQNLSYDNIAKLLGVGQLQQQQQQDLINADRERFDFGQNLPLQKLQSLNQLLQGGSVYAGGTSQQQNALNRNPFASTLGGMMLGSSIGNLIPGGYGNMGGLLGAGAGLLGLFG